MKNKIKFYFIKAFFDGIFFTLMLVNAIHAFVYQEGLYECYHWTLLTLFGIGLICVDFIDFIDFYDTDKLLDKIDKVEYEDTSILGAQLYGKAKLEKTTQDNDLDIKMGKPKSKNDDLDIKMGKYK